MTYNELFLISCLIDSNYDELKAIIDIIKAEYIEEYGEEYRTKISRNFKECNYIFLTNREDLEEFLKHIPTILAITLEKNLLTNLSNLDNPLISKLESLITKEISKIKINPFISDLNLSDVASNIKVVMLESLKNTNEPNLKAFINSQIAYLNELLPIIQTIEKKLSKRVKTLKEIETKKEALKRLTLKDLLEKYHCHLTPEEYNKLFQNIDFDKLDAQNLNISLKNLNITIKDEEGNSKAKEESLKILETIATKYHKIITKLITNLDNYLMPKEEFAEKYFMSDELINNPPNTDLKAFLEKHNCTINYESFNNHLFRTIEIHCKNFIAAKIAQPITMNNDQSQIMYILLKPLLGLEYEKDTVKITFFYNLSHELGHVATLEKNTPSGFNITPKYTYLNELFNEYLSNKVMHRIFLKHPKIMPLSINQNCSTYFYNFFLIEPFILYYEHVFKEASITNSIDPIINLMGDYLLEEYISLIKKFYTYQAKYSPAVSIFHQDKPYVEETKSKLNSIFKRVQERNKELSR